MSTSYWFEDVPAKLRFVPLEGKREVEIVVIGGGITGLMSAYLLSKAGKRVIVLEKNQIGGGESGYTTAFLTYVTDASLRDLHGSFGDAGARLAWGAGREAIDLLDEIIKTERIEADFRRCPTYLCASDERAFKDLQKERQLAEEYGFHLGSSAARTVMGEGGSLQIPQQAFFHPRKFLQGLAEAIQRNGGEIFEDSAVQRFDEKDAGRLFTANGEIVAQQVVIASHSPIDNPYEAPLRLHASQSYVIAARIQAGLIPEALYLDTEDPYHYLRVQKEEDHDLLILGGEDRPTGDEENSEERYRVLEDCLRQQILPQNTYTLISRWSGQILTSLDGLPYIGRSLVQDNHYIATGFAGNGMTFGAIAAKVITDRIMGNPNPYAELFSPSRIKNVGSMMRLGLGVAKDFIKDRLPGESFDVAQLKPGEGKVMDKDGKKVAVFRTPAGKIITCSAICTHLGCVVRWNGIEKSWDCPCHGSRFASTGEVMTGPALEPLAPTE